MRGKFITLEGTEGTGKSTNLVFIKEHIEAAGIELVVTREPGGTPLAEEIRDLLLAPRDEVVDANAELLLIFAARAQHLKKVIEPALNEGKWVLSDRFTDATYAYQGFGRGLSIDFIVQLEESVQQSVHPDLTFYLDIDVTEGLSRAKKRAALDRFELEEVAFFERVRKGYHQRIAANPKRYCQIDAGQALPAVQADISHALNRWLDPLKRKSS